MRYPTHPACRTCNATGFLEDEFGGTASCMCRLSADYRADIEAEIAQRNAEAYQRHMFSKPWPVPVDPPKPVVPDQLTEWDIE